MKVTSKNLKRIINNFIISEIVTIPLNEEDLSPSWDEGEEEAVKDIKPAAPHEGPVIPIPDFDEKIVKVAKNKVLRKIENEWSNRTFSFFGSGPGLSIDPRVVDKTVAEHAHDDIMFGRTLKQAFYSFEKLRDEDPAKFQMAYEIFEKLVVDGFDAVYFAKLVGLLLAGKAVAISTLSLGAKAGAAFAALITFFIAYQAVEDIKRNVLMSDFKAYRADLIKIFNQFPTDTFAKANHRDKFFEALEKFRPTMTAYANNSVYMKPEWAERARKDISDPKSTYGFIDEIKRLTRRYFKKIEKDWSAVALEENVNMIKISKSKLRRIILEELLFLTEAKATGDDDAYPGALGIGTGTGSTAGEKAGEEAGIDAEMEATAADEEELRKKGTAPGVTSAQKNVDMTQMTMLQQKKAALASE